MVIIKKIGVIYGDSLVQIYDNKGRPKFITQLEAQIAAKQDLLISGVNIKTINGMSVLGPGNLVVGGGGGGAGSGEIMDLGDRLDGNQMIDLGQRI